VADTGEWLPNLPVAAIGETLDFYEAIGPARKEARLRYLSRLWTERLSDVPGVRLTAPTITQRAGSDGIVKPLA
jgi:selenocysteine lyase/cysteine desulfurase